MNLAEFIEKGLEAWFLIRSALRAMKHTQADFALVALDTESGVELTRQTIVRGVPIA
jgi:hypothetical protein